MLRFALLVGVVWGVVLGTVAVCEVTTPSPSPVYRPTAFHKTAWFYVYRFGISI